MIRMFSRHRKSVSSLGCFEPSSCVEYKSKRVFEAGSDRAQSWTSKEDSKARGSCFSSSLKSKKKNAMLDDPALKISCMSWMIAELIENMSCEEYNQLGSDIPKDTFPRARYQAKGEESATAMSLNEEKTYLFRVSIRTIQNLTLSNARRYYFR